MQLLKKKKIMQKTQNFLASLHVKFTLRSKDLESFSLAWQKHVSHFCFCTISVTFGETSDCGFRRFK